MLHDATKHCVNINTDILSYFWHHTPFWPAISEICLFFADTAAFRRGKFLGMIFAYIFFMRTKLIAALYNFSRESKMER